MIVLTKKIKYLPASSNPLSADVFFINGDRYCYIFDVGNNDESLYCINQISKEKVIFLSHYHKDHVGNINHITYNDLYVGKKTYEVIGKGEIIEDTLTLNDGIKIEIFHCPSPHTDGSLIINIDNEYSLIADLFFTRPPFDMEKAIQLLDFLKHLRTNYFVISHQEDRKIVPKEKLIEELSTYFGQ